MSRILARDGNVLLVDFSKPKTILGMEVVEDPRLPDGLAVLVSSPTAYANAWEEWKRIEIEAARLNPVVVTDEPKK